MQTNPGWSLTLLIAGVVIVLFVFVLQTTLDIGKRSKREDQGAYYDSGVYGVTDTTTSHHHHHNAGSSHGHAADGGHSGGSDGGGGHGGH